MRKILIGILVFLLSAVSLIGGILAEDIEHAAMSVLQAHSAAKLNLSAEAPVGFGTWREIGAIVPIEDYSGELLAYVAILHPSGYIVFSANMDIDPLIVFSYNCDFSFEEAPSNVLLQIVRADITSRISAIPATPQLVIERSHQLWREVLDGGLAYSFMPTTVRGPLMDTQWQQGSPYNDYCPIDPETGERSVVGCTATSMAQIINYWEYPSSVHFDETESYWSDSTEPPIWIEAETATIESIDYNGAGVHPDNRMKAAISWAAGVSIYSIYGSEGTIAWFHDSSYTNKWNYTTAVKVDPPEMDDFYERLRADMHSAKPAQLGIFYYEPDTSGHAIVCDGLMDTGEYHLNYGWGGFYDAWYRLPEGLPPPMTIVRWAVIDIRPPYRDDAGDTSEEAVAIEPSSVEAFRLDEIHPEGDADWYSFEVVPESTYIFYTVGTTDTRGELYVEDFTVPLISDDNSHDSKNFRISFLPDSAGVCHLRVTGTYVGLYQLRYYCVAGPSMSFISPSGGDVFDEGTSQIIRWEREGFPSIPRIDISYSLEGTLGPWTVFADSITNTGFHMFGIPYVETTLNNCHLRITEASSERFEVISEAFTIRDLAGISEASLPEGFSISAYPNPFNSSVRIFIDGTSELDSPQQIEIFNLAGRKVVSLINSEPSLSEREGEKPLFSRVECKSLIWRPEESLPSGIYLVRAQVKGHVAEKQIILIK